MYVYNYAEKLDVYESEEEMKMKKLLATVLAGVMMVSMIGCGTKEEEPAKEPVDTENSANADEAPADEDQADAKDSEGGTLIVGTEAGFAPYEYLEGDQVVGVDIDICQEIADQLGMKLEVQNMDFDGALIAVQQGKLDMAAAAISVTEEREDSMDFSVKYVDSTEVVVVNAGNPRVDAPVYESLNDKIVGVQQGNVADLYVSDEGNCTPKEIKRYTKFAQAAEDLKNDKIDCIVMDQFPAEELVASSDGALKILDGDPLFEDSYAIAVKKGNQELLDKINPIIEKMKEDGKIDEMITKHSSK